MNKKIRFITCCIALAALLPTYALADISLRAGEWETESVLLVDGVQLHDANSIVRQIQENARSKQHTARGAVNAQNSEPKHNSSKSFHCNEKPSPLLKPEEYAYTMVKDGTGDVWDCSLEARGAAQFDHSFHFSCKTGLGAKSEGEINFSFREKSYKSEIYSKSHMIDDETGEPLSPKITSSHLTIKGRWLSEQCIHSSAAESDSEE